MDNVWFHYNNYSWEKPITQRFQKDGLWSKSIVFGRDYTYDDIWKTDWVEDYIPQAIYDNIYPHFSQFADMRTRELGTWPIAYREENRHNHLNLFNLFLNFLYNALKKEEISIFIIQRAPHLGFDYLNYLMAKEMGIKTLILEQVMFTPNRFFLYTDQYDFGTFNTSKEIVPPEEKLEIPHRFKKNLPHMRKPQLSLKDRVHKFIKQDSATIRLLSELRYKSVRGTALQRYDQKKTFAKNKTQYTQNIDWDEKYVYFPLHLQPEKTTSSWGGKYVDQLLAIERLSDFIPDEVKIYVKENPRQGPFMRGEYFYKRLRKIKQVVLVPNGTDTYKLIKHSLFVSTVTGTAGWEAITGGKKALIFGWGAWYKSLPGVFSFDDNPGYQEILNYKLFHKNLEDSVNKLLKKTGKGILYPTNEFPGPFKRLVPGYSDEKNKNNIYKSIYLYLYGK